MTRFRSALLTCFLSQALTPVAQAAAWPRPQGTGQVFFNFSGYQAGGTFDAQGHRKNFLYDGGFRKIEFNPYIEYGLSSRVTLVGSFFVNSLKFSDQYNTFQSSGSGDSEVGLRMRLNRAEGGIAWSVQGSVKVPTFDRDRRPAPGNHQTDYEGRILAGRSFLMRYFWNVEAGYRVRTSYPADQIRLDGTVGATWGRRWMGLAQVFGITSVGRAGTLPALNNPNIAPKFDLYKTQLSVVYRLNQKTRVQVGWTGDVYGRQVGAGNAVLLSLWREF
jgi:hypothetical protein